MCLRHNGRMKGRKTGSITVFMSLMLMVIGSLLFTLLEGSRYMMLGMMAVLNSQSVTESMFAEYNVPAFQNYHLLMMDSGYGSGQLLLSKVNARMQELGQENLNPEVSGFGRYSNFLQMNVTDSSVVQYELATDQDAGVLLAQIAQLMKKELAADLLNQAFQSAADIQESWKQGKQADDYLDGALDTLEQAKEAAQEENGIEQQSLDIMPYHNADRNAVQLGSSVRQRALDIITKCNADRNAVPLGNSAGQQHPQEMPDVDVENPMEDVKSAKSSPLLAQILSDGERISAKEISKEDAVENRTLNCGNYGKSYSIGAADKLLAVQYLKTYTSNYRNKVNLPHALAYEQEYILFGKYSDEENLKKMASRLLLLREGINFAYLMSDSVKREEAFAMAAAVAAAAGIPAAATAIQMGILASWAYAESIVELRTLFSGGKVAAVKTSASWTVGLAESAAVLFDTSIKSKQVSGGQDYEDYLQAFLIAESTKALGKRFANLLEKNLRLYSGYEQVKLDCMITAMETGSVYQAKQAFLTFVTIAPLSRAGYRYEETYKFSYLEE